MMAFVLSFESLCYTFANAFFCFFNSCERPVLEEKEQLMYSLNNYGSDKSLYQRVFKALREGVNAVISSRDAKGIQYSKGDITLHHQEHFKQLFSGFCTQVLLNIKFQGFYKEDFSVSSQKPAVFCVVASPLPKTGVIMLSNLKIIKHESSTEEKWKHIEDEIHASADDLYILPASPTTDMPVDLCDSMFTPPPAPVSPLPVSLPVPSLPESKTSSVRKDSSSSGVRKSHGKGKALLMGLKER